MTVKTNFRTNFYQNGVSGFAVKHIEDCNSGPTSVSQCEKQVLSVSKTIKCYYVTSYKTLSLDYIGTFYSPSERRRNKKATVCVISVRLGIEEAHRRRSHYCILQQETLSAAY